MADEEVAEEYRNSLKDLTVNSKPLITMLTMLAEENITHAAVIVREIEKYIQQAHGPQKLPVMYLIDSIMKNVGQDYVKLFAQNIITIFSCVFEKVDEKTRKKLYELRHTWNDVFPKSRLYGLDVKVQVLDPAWPLAAGPTTGKTIIHINPNMIKPGVVKGSPLPSPVTQMGPKDLEILKREEQLLELERQKLELEKKKFLLEQSRHQKPEGKSKAEPEKPVTRATQDLTKTQERRSEFLRSYKIKKKPQSKEETQVNPTIHVDPRRVHQVLPVVAASGTVTTRDPRRTESIEPTTNRDPRRTGETSEPARSGSSSNNSNNNNRDPRISSDNSRDPRIRADSSRKVEKSETRSTRSATKEKEKDKKEKESVSIPVPVAKKVSSIPIAPPPPVISKDVEPSQIDGRLTVEASSGRDPRVPSENSRDPRIRTEGSRKVEKSETRSTRSLHREKEKERKEKESAGSTPVAPPAPAASITASSLPPPPPKKDVEAPPPKSVESTSFKKTKKSTKRRAYKPRDTSTDEESNGSSGKRSRDDSDSDGSDHYVANRPNPTKNKNKDHGLGDEDAEALIISKFRSTAHAGINDTHTPPVQLPSARKTDIPTSTSASAIIRDTDYRQFTSPPKRVATNENVSPPKKDVIMEEEPTEPSPGLGLFSKEDVDYRQLLARPGMLPPGLPAAFTNTDQDDRNHKNSNASVREGTSRDPLMPLNSPDGLDNNIIKGDMGPPDMVDLLMPASIDPRSRKLSINSPHAASWEKFREKNPEFKEYQRQASTTESEKSGNQEGEESEQNFYNNNQSARGHPLRRPERISRGMAPRMSVESRRRLYESKEDEEDSPGDSSPGRNENTRQNFQQIVKQAEEQMRRGEINLSQYNQLLTTVVTLVEQEKIREARDRDRRHHKTAHQIQGGGEWSGQSGASPSTPTSNVGPNGGNGPGPGVPGGSGSAGPGAPAPSGSGGHSIHGGPSGHSGPVPGGPVPSGPGPSGPGLGGPGGPGMMHGPGRGRAFDFNRGGRGGRGPFGNHGMHPGRGGRGGGPGPEEEKWGRGGILRGRGRRGRGGFIPDDYSWGHREGLGLEDEWTGEPDLPYVSDEALQAAARDAETRTIDIDGRPLEIRTYGLQAAVVLLDWNDPRILTFGEGQCKIVFDEGQFVLPMRIGEDYKEFTIDGEKHRVKLGVPTQELIIDGRGYQCFFGGKPITVYLAGHNRTVRLDGKPPNVNINPVKNTEFLAGKIQLVIHARKVIALYLDAKPQRFNIDGKPFIIRFVDALRAVTINNVRFPVEFGGLPLSISVRGCRRFLRFTALPQGIIPGQVMIRGMEKEMKNSSLPGSPAQDPSNRRTPPNEMKRHPAPVQHKGPHPAEGPFGPHQGPPKSGMPQMPMMGGPSGPPVSTAGPSSGPSGLPGPPSVPQSSGPPSNSSPQIPPLKAPPMPGPHLQAAVLNVPPNAPNVRPPLGPPTMPPLQGPPVPPGIPGTMPPGAMPVPVRPVQPITTLGNTHVLPPQFTHPPPPIPICSYMTQVPPNVPKPVQLPPVTNTALDINSLLENLTRTGLISTKDQDKNKKGDVEKMEEEDLDLEKEEDKKVPFETMFNLENLRKRRRWLIEHIYRGMQCSSCGMRYPPEQTLQYSHHLDWHFRMNKKQQESTKKANTRKFYFSTEDWLQYEEIEDIEERVPSMFEAEILEEAMDAEDSEEPSVAVSSEASQGVCPACHDTFRQFFHQDTEEWRFFNAVQVDGVNYHPACHQDLLREAEAAEKEAAEKEAAEKAAAEKAEAEKEAAENEVVEKEAAEKESIEKEGEKKETGEKKEDKEEVDKEGNKEPKDDTDKDADGKEAATKEDFSKVITKQEPLDEDALMDDGKDKPEEPSREEEPMETDTQKETEEESQDVPMESQGSVTDKLDSMSLESKLTVKIKEEPMEVEELEIDCSSPSQFQLPGGIIIKQEVKKEPEEQDEDDIIARDPEENDETSLLRSESTDEIPWEPPPMSVNAAETDIASSIDGNTELTTPAATQPSSSISKIKITMSKPTIITNNNDVDVSNEKDGVVADRVHSNSIDEEEDEFIPPPFTVDYDLKPGFKDVELIEQPPAGRGIEMSGLCSIM